MLYTCRFLTSLSTVSLSVISLLATTIPDDFSPTNLSARKFVNEKLSDKDVVYSTKRARKRKSKNSGVEARFEMGAGIYQDIQVPINEQFGKRSDGTDTKIENTDHAGIPLFFSILDKKSSSLLDATYGISLMQMIKLGRTGEAGSDRSGSASGYSRVDLFGTIAIKIPEGSEDLQIGTEIKLRRSSYNNSSTGHYVQSILPGVFLSYGSDKSFRLTGKYATSAYSTITYDNGSGFFHDKIKDSNSQITEISSAAALLVSKNVWLNMELVQETSEIQIKDVYAYQDFGLIIETSGITSRNYSLNTQTMTLGFKKRF